MLGDSGGEWGEAGAASDLGPEEHAEVEEMHAKLPATLSSLSDMEQMIQLLERSDRGILAKASTTARLQKHASGVLATRKIVVTSTTPQLPRRPEEAAMQRMRTRNRTAVPDRGSPPASPTSPTPPPFGSVAAAAASSPRGAGRAASAGLRRSAARPPESPAASPLDRGANPYTARRTTLLVATTATTSTGSAAGATSGGSRGGAGGGGQHSPKPPPSPPPGKALKPKKEDLLNVPLPTAPPLNTLKDGLRNAWKREQQEAAISRGTLVKEFGDADELRHQEKKAARAKVLAAQDSDDEMEEWTHNVEAPVEEVAFHSLNVMSGQAMLDARADVFQKQEMIMSGCQRLMRGAISSDTKLRETLMQHFVEAREAYDVVIVARKGKEALLNKLTLARDAEITEHHDYQVMNTAALQQKEVLTAKLQTMNLKCTEMDENLENEQQKLVIMKLEMYEQLHLIGTLNRETDESEHIYSRMDALRRAANVRREAAEWTMGGLRHDLDAMRGNLAVQLGHVLGVKQQIKSAQVTMMKGQARRMQLRGEYQRKAARERGVKRAKDGFLGLLEQKRWRARCAVQRPIFEHLAPANPVNPV